MTTKSLFVRLCLAAVVFFASIGANAQVTIGAGDAPQSFSVLELISDGERGLRLPQLTTDQRNALSGTSGTFGTSGTLAFGLLIYNTDNNCVEYWNGTRWVSLCEGDSQMTISPEPCQDVAADGTYAVSGNQCDGEFQVTDPDCENGPFSFMVISSSDFASFSSTNEADGTFSLSFAENNSISPRFAVVYVTSGCTGLARRFVFRQDGQECDDSLTAPAILYSSRTLCVDGAVFLTVGAGVANLDQLIWTHNGREIARGTSSIVVTVRGTYAVHMGFIGCGAVNGGSSVEIEQGTAIAPEPVAIIAGANNGFVCDLSSTVPLFASAVSVGTIAWYWDGVRQSATGTTIQAGIGTWFAVVEDGDCSSTLSNEVIVALHPDAGNAGIDVPVIIINGVNLGSATNVALCSGGSLLLEVASPQTGVSYTWFAGDAQNGVVLGVGASISTTVDDVRTFPILQVVAEMANSCAQAAFTQFTISANDPPARPNITSNTSNAMCGTATELSATVTGAVSAASFLWYRYDVRQSATGATFAVTQFGTYTVYAVSASGCVSIGSIPFVISAASGFAQNLQITGNVTPTINSMEGYTATMTNYAGGTFTWTVPAPHSIASGQNTANVTINIGNSTSPFDLSLTARNACGYASPNPVVLTITPGNPCVAPTITNHLVSGTSGTTASVVADVNPPLAVTVNTHGQTVTYQWQRSTSSDMSGAVNVGGNTADLTGVTNLTGGTTHFFRVTVTPACDSDLAVTSQIFTVNVSINPITVTPDTGAGALGGTACFDVGMTTCESIPTNQRNTTNFETNNIHNYTFTATAANVSNVRFVIIDGEGLVTSDLSGVLQAGSLANGSSVTLPVTFATNLNSRLSGRSRAGAAVVEINIIFNNGSTDVRRTLEVRLQDCSCGCVVRVPANVNPSGWLTFMCHNLGADPSVHNLSPTQQAAASPASNHGWLFQWGRTADGHQVRTSPLSSTTTALGGANLNAATGQPAGAFVGQFVRSSGDWRTPALNTLWNSGTVSAPVKTMNDPCPAGWRVPTDTELQAIIGTTSVTITQNWQVRGQNEVRWIPATAGGTSGILIRPAGVGATDATLFLPAAGWRNRDNGALNLVGTFGYYWGSNVSGTTARLLWFVSGSVDVGNGVRANGFSVRCVAE